MNFIKKFQGFTIAEVLITLGIIGIIAELTIPAIIKETKKIEYVALFKKSYSVLSQTYQQIVSDNDSIRSAMINVNDSAGFANLFIQKMRVAQNCGLQPEESPCFRLIFRSLDGTPFSINEITGLINAYEPNHFITIDGIAYSFYLLEPACNAEATKSQSVIQNQTCGIVAVDINGPGKGPSTAGRDLFFLWVTQRGIYAGGSGEEAVAECATNHDGGAYCAYRILTENAMNY